MGSVLAAAIALGSALAIAQPTAAPSLGLDYLAPPGCPAQPLHFLEHARGGPTKTRLGFFASGKRAVLYQSGASMELRLAVERWPPRSCYRQRCACPLKKP